MGKLFSALKNIAVMLLVLSVIAGCSTGGLEQAPDSSDTKPPTGKGTITFSVVKSSDPNTSTTSISKDSPAIVRATAIDSTGAILAGKVMSFSSTFDIKFSPVSGTALTDSNGTAAITIMVGATAGAAIITASISDNTGTPITNNTGITVNLQAPPAVPTGVTVMATSQSQISLTWTASPGAVGYKVYKGGALSTAVTTTSSIDAGLLASTQYCYAVSAYDESGSESDKSSTVCATTQGAPVPYRIDLLVSSTQLNSGDASTVILTALVKDTGNRVLPGQAISFTADSGALAVTSGTTDANGAATATLTTGGDRTNRTINLTASTAGKTAVNAVNVTGTALSISGSASLSFGDSTLLTIFLKDSVGVGIAGKTITVTSLNGNTLGAGPYVTNASGQVIVNVTAAVGGEDTITASAIGATKDYDLMVNTAILRFIDPPPAAVTEIPIETDRLVTMEYISGGVPQAGVAVNFFTTRGVLSSASATTGADGRATVTVSSTNSGPALLEAAVAGGPSSQVAVEFVATSVFSLTLHASPAVIGTNNGGLENEKSLITAVVRDQNNNLVKNKTISFTVVLDASAGRLSPASAITDSFGAANTYFIAGASSGGLEGVTIRASVMGTAVTATTTLTVAKKALFIALATGPTVVKVDPNKYQKNYVALVTDSAGNPVSGVAVVATVTPMHYQKGYFRPYYGLDGKFVMWVPVVTLEAVSSTLPGIPACANEDGILHNPLYDFNGILDPGEDQNGNNRLDPGNVASVTAATTDSTGHGTVSIVYARDYAYWVNVKLEAYANDLKGSTASAEAIFELQGAATDYSDEKTSPPGNPSPFGTSISCYADLTVTTTSSSQITINWQKSATANHYHVYRNGVNIANATQNTYLDAGLSSGTQYCYQIRTVDAAGTESSFTNTVCNTTSVLPPSGLTATAISPSQIRISWNAVVGVAGYHVYRDSEATPLKSVVSTSTVDSGLAANTLYCYTVSGYSAAGIESSQSSTACATTQLAAPPTPTGLTATGSEFPPRVTLAWNATAGANKYNIYRDGGVSPALSVNAPAVMALDNGFDLPKGVLDPKTNYCYAISAEDVSGNESARSVQVCTATGGAAPPTPTGLSATLLAGPQVRLNWSASTGAVVYRIYRNGGAFTYMSAAGTTATDTGVVAGVAYCYTVVAENGAGNVSAKSAAVCIATGSVAPPPTPTFLFALGSVSPLKMTLRWTTSVGAVSYRIYRDGGTIPLLAVTGAQAIDTDVSIDTWYCYTISALDASGNESAQSAPVCALTGVLPPPVPEGLTATANPGAFPSVTLTWSESLGATSYRIYRNGALTPFVSVTGTTATDLTPILSAINCYTVSAVGAGGESVQSGEFCVIVPAAE